MKTIRRTLLTKNPNWLWIDHDLTYELTVPCYVIYSSHIVFFVYSHIQDFGITEILPTYNSWENNGYDSY